MTNRWRGVLYIGVTSDLVMRIHAHKNGHGSVFCKRYNLDKLVLVEEFPTIEEAIAREKAMKAWKREWKIELIERANLEWTDYSGALL